MAYNTERLILAEATARYISCVVSQLQKTQELTRSFPKTKDSTQATTKEFAYIYVSDQNYPADDGVGATARAYVTDPKAGVGITYSGVWRHVWTRFDERRDVWVQMLRRGWATWATGEGGAIVVPWDEAFLIQGSKPKTLGKVLHVQWRNIAPGSVDACVNAVVGMGPTTGLTIQGEVKAGLWNVGTVTPQQTEDGTYIINAVFAIEASLSQTVNADASGTTIRAEVFNSPNTTLAVASATGIARQGNVAPSGDGLHNKTLVSDISAAIENYYEFTDGAGTTKRWDSYNVTEARRAALKAEITAECTTVNGTYTESKSSRFPGLFDVHGVVGVVRTWLWAESLKPSQVRWERQDGHIYNPTEGRNVKAYRYVKITFNWATKHSEDDAQDFIEGGLEGSDVRGYGGLGYIGEKVTAIDAAYADVPTGSPLVPPVAAGWHDDEDWAP